MTPTQVKHPNRATIRTLVAAVIGIGPILPIIAKELGIESIPWVAATLATIATITRILAHPATEAWMKTYMPWLAAEPREKKGRHRDSAD
ncbi:hypothetical protein [Corynebacterium freiburgense]|uniref:hypothetical protein n=1 Tax=Corynebacterium freiburgense TaxID=556548 RepID=UPI000400FAD8|nr:hypothetical protein [Corynebacterium freiburgense]WJZ03470.1 hypothetical protein CFREI_11005 [Corynebacterium freiburgense]WJZ03578.1 hypothetical protein CFREI_11595 [Corynebacterium freiburgense]WJZ03995.1 hypothetical protein CFREI_13745 [Corynebacterium freiburgense]